MALARPWLLATATAASAALTLAPAVSANAQPAAGTGQATATGLASRACPPSGFAVSFSDSLDKLVYHGVELGGLSSLAYDARSAAWVSAVDNHGTDPARIWFFRNLAHPAVTRDPLVLRKPDGTAYDGTNSDNEGLAVLPDGDYLVSSETEPSIRIYGRDGVQKASLPIPARFAVTGTTPDGQATSNATLEGLTISRSGHEIISSMEGALSGDVSPSGDATFHRFLVYDQARNGTWQLTRQIAYRTETGNRIPEVQAYGRDSLLVEEAAFSTTAGNSEELYAVKNADSAPDVSDVANLSQAPAGDVVSKKLVANLVQCPTLGAPSRETQANPLLDNYEGMTIVGGPGLAAVSLISDDNFSATQFTRVLNLLVKLP
ncbi:MAG TPA: esterase-like activity of phytase family protein [Streptosporangiaceae bacterium]